MTLPRLLTIFLVLNLSGAFGATIESQKSGPWSDGATWMGERVPAAGDKVMIHSAHEVEYDLKSAGVTAGNWFFVPGF